MEDTIPIPYNKYNYSNSPVLKYYSHIIDPSNELYNSEVLKLNEINSQKINNMQISSIKKNNQTEPIDENINKIKSYTQKNSNFKLKSEIDIKNDESNNSINEKKIIKEIKPEDLIITKINQNTIIRINPEIYRNASYEFLSNNLYILLKDQLGCKFLQEKLEKAPYISLNHFFPALIPNIVELMNNSFANYFIQKMFTYLNEEQIEYILKIIKQDFFEICINNHGTRVIQRIMDFLITEKNRNLFFEIIKPIFSNLIKEVNGTHIIYKFIKIFPEFLEASNEIIINNILSISTHKRGNIFIQNYISYISSLSNNNLRKNIIQPLLNNCLILIIDPVGNYIIQYLLSLEDSDITINIINKIIDNISFYSKHRYANYVIEKIFIYSNYIQKQSIITKLSSPEIISDLVFDMQGNFVILKALDYADENKRNIILNNINNLKSKIEEMPNGKKFLKKIEHFRKFK
jgi:hypothetical protein